MSTTTLRQSTTSSTFAARTFGVGTDFTQGYGQPFFDWITHDKGYARRLTDFGDVINPEGCAPSANGRT